MVDFGRVYSYSTAVTHYVTVRLYTDVDTIISLTIKQ
jgi:hypothetical protein